MFGASRLALYASNAAAAGAGTGVAWFLGGYGGNGADTRQSYVKKYDMSTDTMQSDGALSGSRDQVQGFANGTTGVAAGGSTGSPITTVDVWALSTGSRSTGTVLGTGVRFGRGASTTASGYILAGIEGAAAVNNVRIRSYSAGTWTTGTSLGYGTVRYGHAVHNNTTLAYLAGGLNYANSTGFTDSKTYTFSGDTVAAGSITLAVARGMIAAHGNQTFMYSMGGFIPSPSSGSLVVEKYSFSTGSTTTLTALATGSIIRSGDASGDNNVGIFAGGYYTNTNTHPTSPGTVYQQANRKFTYSSDTYAAITNYLYGWHNDVPGSFHSIQVA